MTRYAINDFKNVYDFLNDIPLNSIEGYLFPDTYFFKKNETPKVIVKSLLKEFDSKIYHFFLSTKNDQLRSW